MNWVLEGEEKKIDVDYTKIDKDGMQSYVELVDGKVPTAPRTHGWIIYLMYRDFHTSPKKFTPYLNICIPYILRKYQCIFGLTGSLGSLAEREYIEQALSAVSMEVPSLLATCRSSVKPIASNKGVIIEPTDEAMIRSVCDLAVKNCRTVPVLVITRGAMKNELNRVNGIFSRPERKTTSADITTCPCIVQSHASPASGACWSHRAARERFQ